MLIVYESLTGNVRSFVERSGFQSVPISDKLSIEEPYVLVTYTIQFGEVPEQTRAFLARNHEHLQGVASSGNRIWGANFAIAADTISTLYNVPILLKFELRGTKQNLLDFQQRVQALDEQRTYQPTNS